MISKGYTYGLNGEFLPRPIIPTELHIAIAHFNISASIHAQDDHNKKCVIEMRRWVDCILIFTVISNMTTKRVFTNVSDFDGERKVLGP